MTKKHEGARDIQPLENRDDFEIAAPVSEVPHHKRRFGKEEVPAGYIRHRGKRDPIGNELARVSLIINTASGLGFAGPRQVHPEEWAISQSEHGSIAYYKRDGTAPAHSRMYHRPEPSAFHRMYAAHHKSK